MKSCYSDFYISLSVDLNNQLKEQIKKLQKKVGLQTGIKFYYKNSPNLHINIISGHVNEKIFKKFKNIKSLKITSKNVLITNGIGSFIGKKTTVYLRYKNNQFLKELRKKLFNNYKKYFEIVDSTAKDDIWMPKTTIINEIIKKNNYNHLMKILSNFKLDKSIYKSNKLLLFKIVENKEFLVNKMKLF